MDWNDLRYALEVARTGSIAGAARNLGVAHTTVYRRINAFEESSGARFFDRAPSGYVLTEAGRELLAIGGDLEARVLAFSRQLSGLDARLEGEVTVATAEPLALKLAGLLQAFRRSYPGISVRLFVSNAPVDLARREADVALRVSSAPGDELVGRRLASLAFAVYGSRGMVRDERADLSSLDWIGFDATLAETPQGRWEAAHVPPERVVFRTNSRAMFLECVASGAGIGVLPCGLAAQSAALVPLSEVLPELTLPLWLLTHPSLQNTPRIRVLMDFLASAIVRERPLLESTLPT